MEKYMKVKEIQPVITLLLLLGIFILAAWLLEQHPKRWDVTLAKEYTLSPQTIRLLGELNSELEMLAFFQPDQVGRERAAYLLDTYPYASDKIHYRFVDPDREPALAQQHGVKGYGQLVLTYEGREERIGFLTEQDITNAIAKLVSSERRTAYFLTGHGERDINEYGPEGYSRLKHLLEEQNFRVVPLSLMNADQVPSDTTLMVVARPKKQFFKEEISLLNEYVEKGGALLVMLDPGYDGNLREFLGDKNVLIEDDLIIDKKSRVLGGDYLMPVVSKYADHELTKNNTSATIMYEARSVRSQKGKVWITREIAWTSDQSWAETDLKSALEEKLAVLDEEQDMVGPVSVAVVGLKILREIRSPGGGLGADNRALQLAAAKGKAFRQSHIVVLGDSDFAKNAFLDLAGNSELVLNSVNFLARSPELISIRPRSRETNPLTLTYTQARWLFWYSFAFVPGFILLGGFASWNWKRRHR